MSTPKEEALRVVLVDRAGGARRAIAAVLEEMDHVTLVAELDAVEDLSRAEAHDVVVVDDRLLANGSSPLDASRVIVLGMDDAPAFAERALRLGAEAWLRKDTADEGLRRLLAA
jgi:DNA-binding NarL/FixJ family response regulator